MPKITLPLAALLLSLAPAIAGAQTPPPQYASAIQASVALQLAATRGTPLASPAPTPGADVLIPSRIRRHAAPGTVFMIVGGAVAVAGILADEGILIVGGVAVAGYGLYLYLR